jgi:hydrophobic/amphiphilic exporter-1 (mainly G- bacteria), HAE1 family
MALPDHAVRRPVATAMFFLAVVLLGAISYHRLPTDLLPDVAYPRLVVFTRYPGTAPAEVERFVTERVEQAVGSVAGVQRVESVSREGVSLVTVRFAWGANMDFAALHLRERLDNLRAQLPDGASRPAVLRTDPSAEPILTLGLTGATDLWLLRELAESVLKRRLEQVDGVAQAVVSGGLEREIGVEVDAGLLESHGVDIDAVARALDAANASAPGGTVLRGRYRYALRTLGEFQAVAEVGAVPLETRRRTAAGAGAGGLRVRDVARVDDGFRERDALTRLNGRESVGVLVFKEAGANTVRVTERVDEVLGQLTTEYPALTVDVAVAQAGFIADAIANVVQALLLGGLLAFLVLFLFLRDTRYPVAIALAIPISVAGACALLDAAGVSLNIMSLGGLALGVGMLVDNSIVVLENIFRRREEAVRGGSDDAAPGFAAHTAAEGAREVQGAITASTLTTIAVFGPILYVEGVAGEFFAPLALAVAFSLLASLAVALALVPMLATRWRGAGAPRSAPGAPFRRPLAAFDAAFLRFADWYHGRLARALEHRGRVAGGAALLLAATVAAAPLLPRDLLPDVEQGAFRVRLELPRGTPLERTAAEVARLEEVFRRDAEVAAVFTRVGRQAAVTGLEEQESGAHTAVLDVRLADAGRTGDVVRRAAPRLAAFPPGSLELELGQATALGRLLGGGGAALAVRVHGDDLAAMVDYARLVEGRLRATERLANVRLGLELGQPEVRVEIDRERAAAFGLEARHVARTVTGFMRGVTATELVDFDRKIPIVVRLPEADRRSLATLDRLRVGDIPLREVMRSRDDVGAAEVRRLDQRRIVPVYADVAGGGLAMGLERVHAALAEAPPPPGVRVEVGGENEELRRSFTQLSFAFGLALILVYMILAAQFESLVHPLTILLTVPLALAGAIAALAFTGNGLNTMSLIGFVILVGIVVNDAIIKVDFILRGLARGAALPDAILAAGRARLRPILMTTVTTVFGLLPMALGFGRGADLRAPLATAVIGGMLTATALTLVVVPVAFHLLEDARARLAGLAGLAGRLRRREAAR